jgi:hypothetical protein
MYGYVQNVCQSGLHFANIVHSFLQTLALQFYALNSFVDTLPHGIQKLNHVACWPNFHGAILYHLWDADCLSLLKSPTFGQSVLNVEECILEISFMLEIT